MKWNTGYGILGRNDRIAISLSLSTDAVGTGLLSTLVLPARARPGRFPAGLFRRGNRSPGGGPNATIPQWIWILGITVTGSLLVILVFTLFLRRKVEVANATVRWQSRHTAGSSGLPRTVSFSPSPRIAGPLPATRPLYSSGRHHWQTVLLEMRIARSGER
jgi:hypothetical protein